MLTCLYVLLVRLGVLATLAETHGGLAVAKSFVRRELTRSTRLHPTLDKSAIAFEDAWEEYALYFGETHFGETPGNVTPPINVTPSDAMPVNVSIVNATPIHQPLPVQWLVSNCNVSSDGTALVPTMSTAYLDCTAYHAKGTEASKVNPADFESYRFVVNSTGDLISGFCRDNFTGKQDEILYGIRTNGAEVYLWADGAQVNASSADNYIPGDLFRVELADTSVFYYHGGTLLHTTSLLASGEFVPCVQFCSASRLEYAEITPAPTTTTTTNTTTTRTTTVTVTPMSEVMQWSAVGGASINTGASGELTCTDNTTCWSKGAVADAPAGLGLYNTWTRFQFVAGNDEPIAAGLCNRSTFQGTLATMDFAVQLAGADDGMYVFIWQSGVLIAAGSDKPNTSAWDTYGIGDDFEMAIVDGSVSFRHQHQTMYTSDTMVRDGLAPCASFCGNSSLQSSRIIMGTTTTSTTTLPTEKLVGWDALTRISVKPGNALLGEHGSACWIGGARAESIDILTDNADQLGEFNTFEFAVNASGGGVTAGLCPLAYDTGRLNVKHGFFLVGGTVFIWESALVDAHSALLNSSSWDVFSTGDIFQVILMGGNVTYKFINTVLYTHPLGNVSALIDAGDWPLVPCATMCSEGHMLSPRIKKKLTVREPG